MPALEEVFTGEFQIEFDATTARVIEWEELDLEWAAANLYSDVGLIGNHFGAPLIDDEPLPDVLPAEFGQGDPWGFFSAVGKAVSSTAKAVGRTVTSAAKAVASKAVAVVQKILPTQFTGNLRIDKEITLGRKSKVFSYEFSKKWLVKDDYWMEATFEGEGDFDASVTFNPRTSFGMRIPNPLNPNSPKLLIWLDIDAYLRTNIELSLKIAAAIKSAGGDPVSDLEKAIAEGDELATAAAESFELKALGDPDTKPADGWKKTLFVSKPASQVVMAGPVPVVFTQTFQLDLECGFEVRATLDAKVQHQTSHTFRFRAEYEKGGKSSIDGPKYEKVVSRTIEVTGGGEAVISCGLIPRLNAFLYDAVGINVGLRASAVARASYTSTCEADPTNSTPKGEIALGVFGNVGIQFGGRIQAPGSSYAGTKGQSLGADIGPVELWTKQFAIFERTWDVPGLGYCTPTCRNGSTSADEQETDVDCGGACPTRCEASKKCQKNSDCSGYNFCSRGVCSDDHCADGVRTGDESAIDCGGKRCGKCALGRPCFAFGDCQSGACRKQVGFGVIDGLGVCVADLCSDGQRSPGECGIDCGGTCGKCAVGVMCQDDAGCASGASNGYLCVTNACADLKKGQAETDIDCGGPACGDCRIGMGCGADSDCDANAPVCNATTRVCSKVQCANAAKDAGEGDIDCGTSCPTKCTAGRSCAATSDCDLGLECNAGTCNVPTCNDGWKARVEGDVDCGKGCQTQCANDRTCNVAKDCASGICNNGICGATDCFDRTLNGDEADADCGGICAPCAAQKQCRTQEDCASGSCADGRCAAATCQDGLKNQGESDVDCGGPCGGCADRMACVSPTDCASLKCGAGRCAAPSCTDGLINGRETDIDCGSGCWQCTSGRLCKDPTDCQSGLCRRGICADGPQLSCPPVRSIDSAVYFHGDKRADVTPKIRELIAAGEYRFDVRNNVIGQDPAPGVRKTLTIVYTDRDNRAVTVTKMEGEVVEIADPTMPVRRVTEARYFYKDKGADVTARVRALAAGNQLKFDVTNQTLGGDPAYGFGKTLTVTYLNGKCQSVTKAVDERKVFEF